MSDLIAKERVRRLLRALDEHSIHDMAITPTRLVCEPRTRATLLQLIFINNKGKIIRNLGFQVFAKDN
jgi:hypothetical protein